MSIDAVKDKPTDGKTKFALAICFYSDYAANTLMR